MSEDSMIENIAIIVGSFMVLMVVLLIFWLYCMWYGNITHNTQRVASDNLPPDNDDSPTLSPIFLNFPSIPQPHFNQWFVNDDDAIPLSDVRQN